MYLEKHNYVKNWDHDKPAEKHEITIKKGNLIRKDIKPNRISYVIEELGQWRKANAIHKWFVDNVQSGNDDCKIYYVGEDKLKKLLGSCNEVIKASKLVDGMVTNGSTFKDGKQIPIKEKGKYIENSEVAMKLLPCAEGFFFGQYEYDEWYLDYIKYTKKVIASALKEKSGDIYYQSSW